MVLISVTTYLTSSRRFWWLYICWNKQHNTLTLSLSLMLFLSL